MHMGSRLVERYIVRAVLPYLLLALLLLTAILFAQQATSHFAEILVGAGVPASLVTEFALSLLPSVLAFALPMATLVGTLVGFSRMGSDSELVAMRAAGVGTWNMLWPVLLVGALVTAFAGYVNLQLSPDAAHTLRRSALRAALYKLDSPVDPGAFNADIPGYVIYVRDGDKTQGQWGRVFLFAQERDGARRLVTARTGRIDASAEQSELVLSDAVATTLPSRAGDPYVTERLAQLRIVLETGRKEILSRLRAEEREPDELEWRELAEFAASRSGAEGRDAATLFHRRLALSFAPLIFAFLGAGLGLRVRKGGRGLGVLLSLATMISYYLFSLLGEQLGRAGTLPVATGAWLATAMAIGFGSLLLLTSRRRVLDWVDWSSWRRIPARERGDRTTIDVRGGDARWLGFPSLMDVSLLRGLVFSFILAFTALTAMFLIFTLFELWRFIVANGVKASVVGQYLLFLMPLVCVQLIPPSALLASLTTYALMTRRSEAVAWWACGQSVYRLALPGLIFAAALGAGAWLIQERVMPTANLRQDSLRARIRGGGARATTRTGRQWLAGASGGRIYAYEFDEETATLVKPAIYDFDAEGVHLRRVVAGEKGIWTAAGAAGERMSVEGAEMIRFGVTRIEGETLPQIEIEGTEPPQVFKQTSDKPSQLSAKRLSAYIKRLKQRGGSVAALGVALQRKYAEPVSVFVLALVGIPLAVSYGRRSALTALVSAVGMGLAFWATTGGFQQMGVYGLLPPAVAAWAPVVIFAGTGTYLLSRART